MSDQSLVEAFIDPRLGTNAKLRRIGRLIDLERLRPLLIRRARLTPAHTAEPDVAHDLIS